MIRICRQNHHLVPEITFAFATLFEENNQIKKTVCCNYLQLTLKDTAIYVLSNI